MRPPWPQHIPARTPDAELACADHRRPDPLRRLACAADPRWLEAAPSVGWRPARLDRPGAPRAAPPPHSTSGSLKMVKHCRYLMYVLRHKWYVFVYGSQLGIPFLALLHDNSKFLPSEWFPYAEFFYGRKPAQWGSPRDKTGYYKPTDTGNAAFDFAWLLHQKRN